MTQALTSSEGSLASRLIQDRADMLQMELPSLTTRRLALVSFPGGGRGKPTARDALTLSTRDNIERAILIRICDSVTGKCLPNGKCWECTCGHVKEEGEDAPPVIPSPKDSPWGVKGQGQHAARQLTGAPLRLLAGGDVHHLQVVLAVSHLQNGTGCEDRHFSSNGARIN